MAIESAAISLENLQEIVRIPRALPSGIHLVWMPLENSYNFKNYISVEGFNQ